VPLLWINSLANALGQFIYPLLSLILVPVYIHYLGLEGYGLVGFLGMLVAVLGVFTKGLGTALQREFARRDDNTTLDREPLGLLYTFELVYWGIGIALAVVVVVAADWLSHSWINADTIDRSVVEWCLWLVAVRLGLALPSSVYQAVFIGQQRHVLFNTLSGVISVSAAAAAVGVVVRWRSVVGLYATDTAVNACGLWLMRWCAVRALPAARPTADVGFDFAEVRRLAQISIALLWTNGIGLLLTQLDRALISRLLPLSSLGIYSAGTAGGRLLGMCYLPFLTAVYPQTCKLAQGGRSAALDEHLLRNTRVVAVIALACGVPIAWFSSELLEVWTRNSTVVMNGAGVMTLYAIANACLAQAAPLWQAQVALGDTRHNVIFNTLAAFWFPLVLWYLIRVEGLEGAALAWILYCASAWSYHVWITSSLVAQKRWLRGYLRFIAGATLVALAATAAARYAADACCARAPWASLALAGGSSAITLAITWLMAGGIALRRRLAAPSP
jgi:O-antigen/teichoic acid export membrane protein